MKTVVEPKPMRTQAGHESLISLIFILEHGLGHATHARNLEAAVALDRNVNARVLDMAPGIDRLAHRVGGWNWTLEASLSTRRQLGRNLSIDPPDAAYIHTQLGALLSVSFMRSTPTLLSVDATPIQIDSLADGYRHRVYPAPVESLKHTLTARAMAAAAGVVAFSRWAAQSVTTDYGVPSDRVHVLHPGVHVERFHPRASDRARAKPRILFVGADFSRKGGHDLLRAMQALDGRAELDVVTRTPPARTPPGVRIHTRLTTQSQELLELYRNADIFCMPSKGDCFPFVFAEALASGLPCVATNVGGVSDMVVDGTTGLLVPPGDDSRLTEALRTLIDQPDLREKMAVSARGLAEREHDVRRNSARLLTLMRNISSRPGVGHA